MKLRNILNKINEITLDENRFKKLWYKLYLSFIFILIIINIIVIIFFYFYRDNTISIYNIISLLALMASLLIEKNMIKKIFR